MKKANHLEKSAKQCQKGQKKAKNVRNLREREKMCVKTVKYFLKKAEFAILTLLRNFSSTLGIF